MASWEGCASRTSAEHLSQYTVRREIDAGKLLAQKKTKCFMERVLVYREKKPGKKTEKRIICGSLMLTMFPHGTMQNVG